ncbi:hypothetical protein [Desulfovibrio inopinatus]|uniref:hypothetical protein n=1 Tax=Desulfovibrio inopinatus TaxID=102109 RepID=UPI0004107492|nr:hypothetical protein [Desulfovibrio inopinatus]
MLFPDETIQRYQTTKSALKDFHSELFQRVPKKEYAPCARAIGLYKKKQLFFPEDACIGIFADCLIYSWPSKEKSPVATFSTDDHHQLALLSGMQKNVFSLFGMENIGSNRLQCADLLKEGHTEEVIDIGLSRSARSGLIFASRLLRYDDFCCFSGAGFPVFSDELLKDIISGVSLFLDKCNVESVADLGPQEETKLEAIIIKQCVRHKAYEHFFTEDV